jgi:hypothetical protein
VGTRHNVIMLNGKRYDTATGKILESTSTRTAAKTAVAHKPKPIQTSKSGASLDGFARRSGTKAVSAHKTHQSTQKSQTLMRSAVQKPVTKKVVAVSSIKPKKTVPASAPKFLKRPQAQRELRAAHVHQSTLISKFGSEFKKFTRETPHIPVVPAPDPSRAKPSAAISMPSQHAKPVVNPFQSALDNATSHLQPKTKKVPRRHRVARKLHLKPRTLNVIAVAAFAFILGGYVASNNMPSLSMKMASTRAGVHGGLPGYQPSGFALKGPVRYQPGVVTVSYQSNSDSRHFKLIESASNWNSETLLQDHVAVNRRPYQSYQAKGKTIYIYDGSNATWVDSGVWYQVVGDSALNNDQLLRIASSL